MKGYKELRAIEKWLFLAVSSDYERPVLTYAYADDDQTVVAADGYQLHIAKDVKEIAYRANREGMIERRNRVAFTTGGFKFPDWKLVAYSKVIQATSVNVTPLRDLIAPVSLQEDFSAVSQIVIHGSSAYMMVSGGTLARHFSYAPYVQNDDDADEFNLFVNPTRLYKALSIFSGEIMLSRLENGALLITDLPTLDESNFAAAIMGMVGYRDITDTMNAYIKFASEQMP